MSKANPITNAKQFVWLLLTAVLLAACSQPDPQRPSRRMGEEPKKDTVQLALLEMNQQMALAADKQLTQFAQAQDEVFALYESNTWIHIYTPGDTSTPSPKTDEEWTVHMRVYDLKEHLLVDSEASYRIGKNGSQSFVFEILIYYIFELRQIVKSIKTDILIFEIDFFRTRQNDKTFTVGKVVFKLINAVAQNRNENLVETHADQTVSESEIEQFSFPYLLFG